MQVDYDIQSVAMPRKRKGAEKKKARMAEKDTLGSSVRGASRFLHKMANLFVECMGLCIHGSGRWNALRWHTEGMRSRVPVKNNTFRQPSNPKFADLIVWWRLCSSLAGHFVQRFV